MRRLYPGMLDVAITFMILTGLVCALALTMRKAFSRIDRIEKTLRLHR